MAPRPSQMTLPAARTVASARRHIRGWKRCGDTVALVPTMGALHAGHVALIERARKLADRVVVSIFVNPTQFGPREDFSAYPRTWAGDRRACRAAGVDLIFAPTVQQMYPDGFDTIVHVGKLGRRWESERRPGHFDGVATICLKLFTAVEPDIAVFGQKDYQQSRVIARLIADFNLPLRLVVAPTVREPGGLALSSRNAYFPPAIRREAAVFHRALRDAARSIRRADSVSCAAVRRVVKQTIEASATFKLDYFGICDPETLEPMKTTRRPAVLLLAVLWKDKRFIDNVMVWGK